VDARGHEGDEDQGEDQGLESRPESPPVALRQIRLARQRRSHSQGQQPCFASAPCRACVFLQGFGDFPVGSLEQSTHEEARCEARGARDSGDGEREQGRGAARADRVRSRSRGAADAVGAAARGALEQQASSKDERRSGASARVEAEAKKAREELIHALEPIVCVDDNEKATFDKARGDLRNGTSLEDSLDALVALGKRWLAHEDPTLPRLLMLRDARGSRSTPTRSARCSRERCAMS
jgi:hypothetical protein